MKKVIEAYEKMVSENLDQQFLYLARKVQDVWNLDKISPSLVLTYLKHKPSESFYILSSRELRPFLQDRNKVWTPADLKNHKLWQVQWFGKNDEKYHIWNLSEFAASELVTFLSKYFDNVQSKEIQR